MTGRPLHTEVGDFLVTAPTELFSAVMALTVALHRDPAPGVSTALDSTALDSTGLYRGIPLSGDPAVAEYVINPEPPDTRHIVSCSWPSPGSPTSPKSTGLAL
jgi:hypothetical protein